MRAFLIAAVIAVALFMSGGAKTEGIMSGPCIGCAEGIYNVRAGTICPVPTVTAVSPNSGSTAGGTAVTVSGTNFTGATGVNFGAINPASFSVTNPTTISVPSSPPGSAGTVDVLVTTPCGTSAISAADHFTYQTPVTLALDGKANTLAFASSTAANLTTLGTNDIIIVYGFADVSGATTITVSDVAGLTWTDRCSATTSSSGGGPVHEFWAIAPSPLTADTITFTASGGSPTAVGFTAFGVNGAHTAAPFDGSCVTSGTQARPTDPQSITTTHANTFIMSGASFSTASPTSGVGFTLIEGANFSGAEYVIESTTQTGLSFTWGTGAGGTAGMLVDAIIAGP